MATLSFQSIFFHHDEVYQFGYGVGKMAQTIGVKWPIHDKT